MMVVTKENFKARFVLRASEGDTHRGSTYIL
jgi:hypothetical protein